MKISIEHAIHCNNNVFTIGDIVEVDFKRDDIVDKQVGRITKIDKDDCTFCIDCSTNFHSSIYDIRISNVVSMAIYEYKK